MGFGACALWLKQHVTQGATGRRTPAAAGRCKSAHLGALAKHSPDIARFGIEASAEPPRCMAMQRCRKETPRVGFQKGDTQAGSLTPLFREWCCCLLACSRKPAAVSLSRITCRPMVALGRWARGLWPGGRLRAFATGAGALSQPVVS